MVHFSRFYPKGSFIFREGNPAHVVHDGLVRVLRHSRSGRKLIFVIPQTRVRSSSRTSPCFDDMRSPRVAVKDR